MSAGNGHKAFEQQVLERFEEHDRRFDAMQQSIAELTTRLIDRMDAGFAQLGARLEQTNERLDKTNQRLDQVIMNTGRHWRDLEQRVTALEDRLDPP